MAIAALTIVNFIRVLMPDLVAVARALYKVFDGDVDRARKVLEIVRDHGARLDRERLELDRELAEMRAERAEGKERS
jgi:predicted RecB family endonuclease